MGTPVYDMLVDIAVDQHGYVSARDLTAHGIDPTNLRKLAARGRLERVAQGLYRLPALAQTAHAEYAEAVLWTGARGCISHSSALALYELCDVNPSRIHLTVPAGYGPRRAGGELYRVHRHDLQPNQVTTFDGIAVVTPAVAIAQAARAGEDPAMLHAAIANAQRRQDLPRAEAARLRRLIDRQAGPRPRRTPRT